MRRHSNQKIKGKKVFTRRRKKFLREDFNDEKENEGIFCRRHFMHLSDTNDGWQQKKSADPDNAKNETSDAK